MRTLSDGPHLKGTLSRGHGRVDTWTSRAGPPEMLILPRFLMLFKKTGHFEDATTGTPRL